MAIFTENNPYHTGGPWLRLRWGSPAEGNNCWVDLLNNLLVVLVGTAELALRTKATQKQGDDG